MLCPGPELCGSEGEACGRGVSSGSESVACGRGTASVAEGVLCRSPVSCGSVGGLGLSPSPVSYGSEGAPRPPPTPMSYDSDATPCRSTAPASRSSTSSPSGDSIRAAASLTSRLRPSRATTAAAGPRVALRYASSSTRSTARVRARSSASTAAAAASASAAPGCGEHSAHSPEATVTVPSTCPVSGASTGTLTADTSCHRSRKCSGPCTSARRRVRRARAALLCPTSRSDRSVHG